VEFTVIDATGIKGVRDVISNYRHITGYISVAGVGLVPYEGPLERDFLELVDFNRSMEYVGAQPLRLISTKNKKIRYTADFLCKPKPRGNKAAHSPVLYEVKTRADLMKDWDVLLPKFKWASQLCRVRGWRFRIATERMIRPHDLARLKFLRGFLDHEDPNGVIPMLESAMGQLGVSTPNELLNATCDNLERRLEATALLWKAVIDGRIRLNLGCPLNMETRIWSPTYEGT
jgi:hypothetical protein